MDRFPIDGPTSIRLINRPEPTCRHSLCSFQMFFLWLCLITALLKAALYLAIVLKYVREELMFATQECVRLSSTHNLLPHTFPR